MAESFNKQPITRRQILGGAGAITGFCLLGSVSYAESGHDPEPPSQPISNDPPPAKKKKSNKTRVMFTQKNYHKISTKGLRTAIKGIDAGHDYWIEGFSKKMSRNIFEMTLVHRKYALFIFKKMRKLKSKEMRKDYLEDQDFDVTLEIERLERVLKPKNSLDNLDFDERIELVERVKTRLKWLKAFRKLLRRWIKKPMEGRLTGG